MIKAGGQWSVIKVTAKGSPLVVTLNGVNTADVEGSKLAGGPIALQCGRGTITFRKLQVKAI